MSSTTQEGPAASTTGSTATTIDDGLTRSLGEWADRLPAGGCTVVADAGGSVLVERDADLPVPPASAIKLFVAAAALQSLGPETTVGEELVGDLVGRMVADSDNDAAHALVEAMGGGSEATGLTDVAGTLGGLGFTPPSVVVADATGHDSDNRVTCRALVDLLSDPGLGPQLEPTLAVAGRSGTLADDFVEEPFAGVMLAKTGSLAAVSALTGIVDGPGGRTYFAVVIADPDGVDAAAALAHQSELGRILVDG